MMKTSSVARLDGRKKASALIVPFWENKKGVKAAADLESLKTVFTNPISSGDFKGKSGETFIVHLSKQPETRLLMLGLGEETKVSVEMLRRAYGAAAKVCRNREYEELNLVIPNLSRCNPKEVTQGVFEGILSINYSFDILKKEGVKKKPPFYIKKINLVGGGKEALDRAKKVILVSEGVYFARDLSNGNADDINPVYLGKVAKDLAKKCKQLKTTVFDKKRILKEGMGLLLAVNRGSHIEPSFIIMEYRGNPRSKEQTVIIGKGVTYDTGGLNLKPTGYMETMKTDMSGAAACFGIIRSAINLGLKENITAVIPSTENSIDSQSFKPGDVYTSYAGKSVEIGNTDAEGRLILADALAYVCKKIKPTRIIDFATLTGAVDVALGSEATGVMGNCDSLIQDLKRAGQNTFERLWQLPLFDEYREHLKSDVADLKNVGNRSAGSCVAGMFLKEFVSEDIPWAHCDIASTAYLSKSMNQYLPKNATGVGVRLILEYLELKGKSK